MNNTKVEFEAWKPLEACGIDLMDVLESGIMDEVCVRDISVFASFSAMDADTMILDVMRDAGFKLVYRG